MQPSSAADPVVSVVVPTYQRAHLLPRALSSLLAQDFRAWEAIVVDDASTDGTDAVVEGVTDERVRYVRREQNGGVAAAQNTGVALARGPHVAFLHSDDEWAPERLRVLVAVLDRADESVAAVESGLRVDEGGVVRTQGPVLRGVGERALLAHEVGVHLSGMLFRRDALMSNPFDERLRAYEDWDLLVRLLQHRRFEFVDAPLATLHVGGGDRLAGRPAMLEAVELLLEKYADALSRDRRARAVWHFKLARYHHAWGGTGTRRHLVAAVRDDPRRAKLLLLAAASLLGPTAYGRAWQLYTRASERRRSASSPARTLADS